MDARQTEPVLVTGAAGFIGFHLSRALLHADVPVVGLDNCNAYYSPQLKRDRLAQLQPWPRFRFVEMDLIQGKDCGALFARTRFRAVVHLAAQAGVRYSLENPAAYINSNLVAFGHVLEGCRRQQVPHLVYASSSSVYGANRKLPFAETDPVDHPVSLYGATKRANELMAHTYSHLFGLPCTGLRFFTVYGPWGRPDMAYWTFTRKILAGEPLQVFNHGRMGRDFTYVDDVAASLARLLSKPPRPQTQPADGQLTAAASHAPWRVFNIGNRTPVPLLEFIRLLEEALGKKAVVEFMPMQAGDVQQTHADVTALQQAVGFQPGTRLQDGLAQFVAWYRAYHGC
ncbi:MAG: NAD-dependent epimerase [Cyanobacteria bacterium MAG CAR4_bin_6]|nr:NAD-dependent epimerase [Cyanobacteria bacterium MAG CAR4_bin_6]